MAVVSQNGWSANDPSVVETYTIGARTKVRLRKGDAGFLLKHFADWFDENIRDIDENYNHGALDDWGYAERPIRGGTELSNHASGTALDINATCWVLGNEASVYLTAVEIAKIREHLKIYEGALRWGGDYVGRKDPMHVEIDANSAEVTRVANKLRGLALGFPVAGSIRAAFDRAGALNVLGQPLGPEVPTVDKAGRLQRFEHGNAYWHPQVDKGNAHVLTGAILARFVALGNELAVGWPTTDELGTPDGKGRFNHFSYKGEPRSIYWFPGIGAKYVKGAIRGAWAASGYEVGPLGYPTDEEHAAEGGIVQSFQRGSILWKDGKAVVRVK